jgi:hypothetical protein
VRWRWRGNGVEFVGRLFGRWKGVSESKWIRGWLLVIGLIELIG